MNGLEPAVPQLSVIPYAVKGEHAQTKVDEINGIVASEYNGNQSLSVLSVRDIKGVPTMIGSNPLVLPVLNRVVVPDFRVIRPEKMETTLQEGDILRVRGNHYVDLGLVLDFSGKNHDLAFEVFDRLPTELRDFDRLPAVMVGYGLANTEVGSYGVMPTYNEGTELRTSPILAKSSGNFDASDRQLIVSGLPSQLGRGKRYLYNSTQGEPSKESLGLSRLFLDRYLILNSDNENLANSNEDGRVAFSAEGASRKK